MFFQQKSMIIRFLDLFFINNKNLLTKNFKNEGNGKKKNSKFSKKTYHDGAQFYT